MSNVEEDLICYSYDGSMGTVRPELVAHPASTAEVASVQEFAGEAGIPVVARGAGTGLSGGSIPVAGGIVLHIDRMNRLKLLDTSEMLAVAEPGITNWELRAHSLVEGLYYPPDPSSSRVCTLGGNVAENAGGPSSFKYGATGDYVIGLEAVLSPGILPADAEAVLIVEVDGETGGIDQQIPTAIEACESSGGYLLRRARDDQASEKIWESRRSVSAALGRITPTKIGEDSCVPRAQVPEMLERLRRDYRSLRPCWRW